MNLQARVLAGTILSAAAVAAAPGGAAYTIDPARARAGFDLGATLHTVHGSTTAVSGAVRVDGALGGPLALSGRIDVDAASLDTGSKSRDKDLHGKSLDAPRFPSISLAPARFIPEGLPDAEGRIRGSLEGDLTIRGVTKPVAIEATLAPEEGRVTVQGRFDVLWADYGIPNPSVLFLRVDKVVHAHFEAVFVPSAPGSR